MLLSVVGSADHATPFIFANIPLGITGSGAGDDFFLHETQPKLTMPAKRIIVIFFMRQNYTFRQIPIPDKKLKLTSVRRNNRIVMRCTAFQRSDRITVGGQFDLSYNFDTST